MSIPDIPGETENPPRESPIVKRNIVQEENFIPSSSVKNVVIPQPQSVDFTIPPETQYSDKLILKSKKRKISHVDPVPKKKKSIFLKYLH